MDLLQIRESGVFETLKKLMQLNFVVIGGYAANAYTLPRFSLDCDIVAENKRESDKIETVLLELGYKKIKHHENQDNFRRYEKQLESSFKISFDILIGEIIDRQTAQEYLPVGYSRTLMPDC